MKISNLSNSGLGVIQKGMTKIDRSAELIGNLSTKSKATGTSDLNRNDLVKALVDAKEAKLETQAGVKLIGVYDEMIGSVLDLRA